MPPARGQWILRPWMLTAVACGRRRRGPRGRIGDRRVRSRPLGGSRRCCYRQRHSAKERASAHRPAKAGILGAIAGIRRWAAGRSLARSSALAPRREVHRNSDKLLGTERTHAHTQAAVPSPRRFNHRAQLTVAGSHSPGCEAARTSKTSTSRSRRSPVNRITVHLASGLVKPRPDEGPELLEATVAEPTAVGKRETHPTSVKELSRNAVSLSALHLEISISRSSPVAHRL